MDHLMSPPESFPQSRLSNPSARLPVELLSDIFQHCATGGIDAEHTIYVPLLLTQICSRWRAAALANHQLWSRLFIQIPSESSSYASDESDSAEEDHRPPSSSSPIERRGTSIKLVETWIQRSGVCPLTLYVVWDDPPSEQVSHPVLESLMDVSHRWQTMFFYLPLDAFKPFNRIRGNLPILSTLSLGTDDDGFTDGMEDKFDMFEIAPRLRSLESINFSPTAFRLPWNQLQDIPIVSGSIDQCLDILSRSTQLDKLGFIFTESESPVDMLIPLGFRSIPTVDHQHLRSLTIMTPVWNENVSLANLFPHLTLPNLETLTICNVKSSFGPEFIQFLSKLQTLKTLHLRKTSVTDEQLVQALRSLQSLTCLMVHPLGSEPGDSGEATTVTRYLLDSLTRNYFSDDVSNGMLLPMLKKLELTVSTNVAREPYFFLDMVQSRMRDEPGLAKLEHVRIKLLVELGDEFLFGLVELQQMGLILSVEYAHDPEQPISP